MRLSKKAALGTDLAVGTASGGMSQRQQSIRRAYLGETPAFESSVGAPYNLTPLKPETCWTCMPMLL